jgi:hypothetical protein
LDDVIARNEAMRRDQEPLGVSSLAMTTKSPSKRAML